MDIMAMQKRKTEKTGIATASFAEQDLPLETLVQLIGDGLISDEIPFELLADQYPSLLEDWYPGYPGAPRMMTPEDPMCLVGRIENGTISFKGMPGLKNIPFASDINPKLEGEHKVWLRREKDSWFIHVTIND